MASRTKGGRPSSPVKKQNSLINNSQSQMHHDEQHYMDRELFRGLTETQVENEHLKTTIVALSEQVAVSYIILIINSILFKRISK